mmetsp:Transcript_50245/g.98307  ORF Transcript_50245/g.98307 Transcript_50245/m.98307 type:complete len:96 (+) Transcript_50245:89-376(+)
MFVFNGRESQFVTIVRKVKMHNMLDNEKKALPSPQLLSFFHGRDRNLNEQIQARQKFRIVQLQQVYVCATNPIEGLARGKYNSTIFVAGAGVGVC